MQSLANYLPNYVLNLNLKCYTWEQRVHGDEQQVSALSGELNRCTKLVKRDYNKEALKKQLHATENL